MDFWICYNVQIWIVICFKRSFRTVHGWCSYYSFNSKSFHPSTWLFRLWGRALRINCTSFSVTNEHFHFCVCRWWQMYLWPFLAYIVIHVHECAVVYCFDIDSHFTAFDLPGLSSAGPLFVIIDSSFENIDGNAGQLVPNDIKYSLYSPVVFIKALISLLVVVEFFLSQFFFFCFLPISAARRLSLLFVPLGNIVSVLCYRLISSSRSSLMQHLALL